MTCGAARNGGLVFSLPLPPSVNHCYRSFVDKHGRRRRIPTDTAKRWTFDAQAIALEAMRRSGWTVPQQQKVVVEYSVFWPDNRRRDPSNLEKVLLDALQVVTGDDRWVLPRCMDFDVDRGAPRVEVFVRRA